MNLLASWLLCCSWWRNAGFEWSLKHGNKLWHNTIVRSVSLVSPPYLSLYVFAFFASTSSSSWSTTTWGQWPGKSVPLLVLIVELQMCFFLCPNSTFIFPGKIEPVADQRSENESYREQIYTLTMWFSTTNELCNQYLLQNDKLKQHRCIFPVKHSAQSASGHGCGLVSKCMHVFISPRCNSFISLLEYAAYVPPPPSSIVYYNNTVKGTGGGRLQMRYQSHQINQMGRISGEEGVWCKFPSVWKRCLPHLTRLIMKLSVTSINSPGLVSSHPPQRFCVRRVDDTAVTPWQKVGVVSTHWSH